MGLSMVYFVVSFLLFPLAKTLTFHTYLKDKSIYQQKLYYKYSVLVEDVESCATFAIDKDHDKFMFNSGARGLRNCTFYSYCSETGEAVDAEETHTAGWSK